jgi:hypothetical protein
MEERYRELLALTLIYLSQKVKKDYESEAFANILTEDIGFGEDEVEDIVDVMNELA